jgi:hypothetical protein
LRARAERLLPVLIACGLLLTFEPKDTLAVSAQPFVIAKTATRPLPLARDDADRDGLSDSWESELAVRYAPIVILDPNDRYRPASVEWLLAHVPHALGPRSVQLASSLSDRQDAFPETVRMGSSEPRDWVTYVHVYPRTDGDINIQYWFFYPFNDGRGLFDHEGDWEHVTVQTDWAGRARTISLAQHRNTRPGATRSWSTVVLVGDHPVVWSARGTHASYAAPNAHRWFDSVSSCLTPASCSGPIWRTWEAGGLVNIGERGALLGADNAFAYEGLWGGSGRWLRGRAPRGPVQQRGAFTNAGF